MEIDGDHVADASHHRIAAGKARRHPARNRPRRRPISGGGRVVGPLQRLAHVLRHRAGDQQHIGMARRGDEAETEALEIVVGVVEGMDLQLAAIAGAGVDLADRRLRPRRLRAALTDGRASSVSAASSGDGAVRSAAGETGLQTAACASRASSEIVARIGAIEGFVAEGEVGDDIALDCRLQSGH